MNKALLFSGKDLSHLVDYSALLNSKPDCKINKASKQVIDRAFDNIAGDAKTKTIEEFISIVDDSILVDVNNRNEEIETSASMGVVSLRH